MTPSFLEHWAQRVFDDFESGSEQSVAAESGLDFNGMVIVAVYWLGSTTANQFFKTIPYPSPLIYFSRELIRYMLLHGIIPQISSTMFHTIFMNLQRV